MNLPYELRIGLRYTRAGRRARRRNGFISFISGISMAGIALGVMALIVVLSVMNGFVSQVRDRMLSVVSHIEVFSLNAPIDWQRVEQDARRNPEVIGAAPYVNAQALLTRGDAVRGVLVRGIDPQAEPAVSDIASQVRGEPLTALKDGEFGIVLGGELARALGVALGEKVTLIAPQGQVTPAGVVPRLKQFTVTGTFDSGHYEYDSALALVHIGDAQKLFRVDGPTGVRLKIRDMQRAAEVAAQLVKTLPPNLLVRDWSRQNPSWFAAVQVEKRMMFIILALIVAVAAFNLVSTLVMTVTEKQSDIAILRTLGASPRSVMAVFIVQGALIGVLGTLLGVAGGLFIANNLSAIFPTIERIAGFPLIPKDIYFISSLPSEPRSGDIVPIAVISIILSLVATLYPSWRASRVRPAEALRYD
ncbi:MAG TPA: lipoprotein-releasing ABC transporter permease subunit [Burkholderiaceae bacterium]|nr:lipoprotein-releasing ABC transporter permease subunit [Burkholderiaceae bacterium]HQR69126.1 lipoprotein-releasing ABC transporter permease subunit [Burkholderiaceae bacterium]